MQSTVFEIKEVSFAVAIGRVLLGLIITAGVFMFIDLLLCLGTIDSIFDIRAEAAFNSGYDKGYAQTYELGYQESHGKAYQKGYSKGYEIGLGSSSEEQVGSLVELHNPTYEELKEFLAADKTDSNSFINGEYVCFDFAAELNNNAEANGIRAGYVRIRSEEWGHAVVAFKTIDRGLIFIEPQSDREVELVIGSPYPWWLSGATSPLSRMDAVEEIQVIW